MTQLLQLRSGNSGPAFIGQNQNDTVLWDATAKAWYVGPGGGGGGAVDSVFGRTGVVVAQTGDYDSDQVDNLSNVSGASVSDAIDALNISGGFVAPAAAANLGATPALNFATNRYIRGILNANATPTITMPAGYECFLELRQPAAGGPFVVSAWPANVRWTDGTAPTLSTGANARDFLRFLSDGTQLIGWAQAMNVGA